MSALLPNVQPAESPEAISVPRALIAIFLAPGIPSAIYAAWAGNNQNWGNLFTLFWFFGVFLSLLIGMPVFLLLRNRIAPRAIYAALVGGLIPTLPFLLFKMSLPDRFSWLQEEVQGYGILFALGALGGIIFWALVIAAANGNSLRNFANDR